jgi:hypothetical protein
MGDKDSAEQSVLKQASVFLRHASIRVTARTLSQTQSCVLCASERLRDVEGPARALYRARGLRRIGRAEIPVAGEVGNIGYLAQLVRLPCLSNRARGTLWTSHRAPLGEEMWNSGNSVEAQRGMRCPGSWIARKNALEKLRARAILFPQSCSTRVWRRRARSSCKSSQYQDESQGDLSSHKNFPDSRDSFAPTDYPHEDNPPDTLKTKREMITGCHHLF